MYSNLTDHSRNLMSSEDSKIEQIGTQKSALKGLPIEGIYASRSQNWVDRLFCGLLRIYELFLSYSPIIFPAEGRKECKDTAFTMQSRR